MPERTVAAQRLTPAGQSSRWGLSSTSDAERRDTAPADDVHEDDPARTNCAAARTSVIDGQYSRTSVEQPGRLDGDGS
jgi:hypothetical protein